MEGGALVVVGSQQCMGLLHGSVQQTVKPVWRLVPSTHRNVVVNGEIPSRYSRVAQGLCVEVLGCAIRHTHVQGGVLSAKDLLHRRICNARMHTGWVQILDYMWHKTHTVMQRLIEYTSTCDAPVPRM